MGGLWSDLVNHTSPPAPSRDPYQHTSSPSPASFGGNVANSRVASSSTVPTRDSSSPASFGGNVSMSRVASTTTKTTFVSSSASRSLYSWQGITIQEPIRMSTPIASTLPLVPSVYRESDAVMWSGNPLPHGKSFRLVNVPEYEEDFVFVSRNFQNGAKRKNFEICKIERVENPYLLGCYLLKKEEMKRRPYKVQEVNCFHGTKKVNIDSICENNFNWRLYGDSTGSRYGKGVSFSPISYYASHYSDKNNADKVMFYVKVLISNITLGNENMVIPPKLSGSPNVRYDTATKAGGQVVVKFSDNEFYPQFIIYYRISPSSVRHHHPNARYKNYRDPCAVHNDCFDDDD